MRESAKKLSVGGRSGWGPMNRCYRTLRRDRGGLLWFTVFGVGGDGFEEEPPGELSAFGSETWEAVEGLEGSG